MEAVGECDVAGGADRRVIFVKKKSYLDFLSVEIVLMRSERPSIVRNVNVMLC